MIDDDPTFAASIKLVLASSEEVPGDAVTERFEEALQIFRDAGDRRHLFAALYDMAMQ